MKFCCKENTFDTPSYFSMIIMIYLTLISSNDDDLNLFLSV